MTAALEGVSGQRHALAALYPRQRPGTHCTGGWVGLSAGLDRCGKSHPHRDSIPGPSSPWPVAIPTTLPGPLITVREGQNRPWVSVTLIYEGVKLERGGKDWYEPALDIHTPLSSTLTPIFSFAPLHISSQRKTFLGAKNI